MQPWPDRLSRFRRAVGLSQAKVAEILGIKAASVAQWEIGRSKPKIDRLPDIARLYRVSLKELCGDDLPFIEAEKADIDAFYGQNHSIGPQPPEFTKDENERALLLYWRDLNKTKKKLLLHLLASGFDWSDPA